MHLPLPKLSSTMALSRIGLAAVFLVASLPREARAEEGLQAHPASAFLATWGVNTHSNWKSRSYAKSDGTADTEKVKRLLAYVGIKRIRDYVGWPYMLDSLRRFGEAGILLNLFVTEEAGADPIEDQVASIASLLPHVIAIEGLNEPDLRTVWYEGITAVRAVEMVQHRLHEAVKANKALAAIPVLQTSVGHLENYADYRGLAHADRGNMHCYFFNFDKTIADIMPDRLSLTKIPTPGKPIVTTETGWPTRGSPGAFVNEETQAALLVTNLLIQFQFGVEQTYIYQLMDEDGQSDFYGLFTETGKPKPAAHALHRLSAILRDDVGSTPGIEWLPVIFARWPQTGKHLLLQRRNGDFLLLLWNDVPVWDAGRNEALNVADVPVQLRFPGRTIACLLNPVTGTPPSSLIGKGGTFAISLPPRAIILELKRDRSASC